MAGKVKYNEHGNFYQKGKPSLKKMSKEAVQNHTHPHGHEHGHDHEGGNPHEHKHVHQNTKAVLNRLSKAIGHLEKVRQMVEDGEDCSEVLIQLAAVRSALNNTGKIILKDHIDHCIVDAVECGDTKALEDMNKAIERFM